MNTPAPSQREVSSEETLVRLAVTDDLDQLTQLAIAVQRLHADGRPDLFQEPDAEGLRAFMTSRFDDDFLLLVAVRGNSIVGYLLADTIVRADGPFLRASSTLTIQHISVSPIARRQGVGGLLLRGAISEGESRSLTAIRLESWAFNEDAHAFFRAEGFAAMRIAFEKPLR